LILSVEHSNRTLKDKPILYRFAEPPLRYRVLFFGDRFRSSSNVIAQLGARKADPIASRSSPDIYVDLSLNKTNSMFVNLYEMKCEASFGEDITETIKFDLWDFQVRFLHFTLRL